MKTLLIIHPQPKIKARIKLMPVIVLALLAVAGQVNHAMAQRLNLSDWNVPPPLPPGTITKGNTTGKIAPVKTIVLIPADIPTLAQPVSQPVQVPVLAAISTTAPVVDAPGQPTAFGEAGLPDMPSPAAPDAPQLPQQSLQDEPMPSVIDLPATTAPDIPPFPPEPTPSGQTSNQKQSIPVMPDVVSQSQSLIPTGVSIDAWATPAIPEDTSLKSEITIGEKDTKPGGSGTRQSKTHHSKSK